jgi:hypothetical protein
MTLDLTGVLVAIVGGFFSIATLIVGDWINTRMKDAAARTTLQTAVQNSLGAIQQAATLAITTGQPQITIPGIPPNLAVGVQYVLDHAGDEVTRLGVTPELISSKISAQVGLGAIATNLAIAASAAPLIPAPLGPVPLTKPPVSGVPVVLSGVPAI